MSFFFLGRGAHGWLFSCSTHFLWSWEDEAHSTSVIAVKYVFGRQGSHTCKQYANFRVLNYTEYVKSEMVCV